MTTKSTMTAAEARALLAQIKAEHTDWQTETRIDSEEGIRVLAYVRHDHNLYATPRFFMSADEYRRKL